MNQTQAQVNHFKIKCSKIVRLIIQILFISGYYILLKKITPLQFDINMFCTYVHTANLLEPIEPELSTFINKEHTKGHGMSALWKKLHKLQYREVLPLGPNPARGQILLC